MSRTPLLMLSGMLGDRTTWSEVARLLEDVAEPHFPRIDVEPTIAGIAKSVLRDAPSHFALAGHSLGGIVALDMVRQAPERVTRLALVNTSGRHPSSAQLQSWGALARRTEAGEFAAVAAELGRQTLPESRRTQALVDRNTAMAHTVGPKGFRRQLDAQASRTDARPRLSEVGVPSLVLSGALDHVCPPALQTELAEGIPNARHETLEGVGHMSPLEDPGKVAEHLRRWLTDGTEDRAEHRTEPATGH